VHQIYSNMAECVAKNVLRHRCKTSYTACRNPSQQAPSLGVPHTSRPIFPFTCHLVKHCVFVPPHALKPNLVGCFLLEGSRLKTRSVSPGPKIMLTSSEIIFCLMHPCRGLFQAVFHYCETSTRTLIVLCTGPSPRSVTFLVHQASRSLPGMLSSFLHPVVAPA